jgi:hypothetical protein
MKAAQRCFLLFVFLSVSTITFAEPFLVSDPYPIKGAKPIKFLITIDGKTSTSMPVKNSEGSVYFKYDLGSLSDGTYTVAVKAVGAKGVESPSTTYSFKKIGSKVEPYTPPVPKQKIAPSRESPGYINR